MGCCIKLRYLYLINWQLNVKKTFNDDNCEGIRHQREPKIDMWQNCANIRLMITVYATLRPPSTLIQGHFQI